MSAMAPIPRPPEGDVDIGYKLTIGTTITFIAAAIVVGMRFIARIFYARLGWDDYIMMFATVCVLCATYQMEEIYYRESGQAVDC